MIGHGLREIAEFAKSPVDGTLERADVRGAAGSEANSGDGAGILTQVPDALLRASVDFDLPPVGEYAVGIAFLPADESERASVVDGLGRLAAEEGLTVLGWRELPVDPEGADLGPTARAVMPHFAQVFVAEALVNISVAPSVTLDPDEKVWIEFDQTRLHLFDGETTNALSAA